MNKSKRERVGERHLTNEGYWITIIEYDKYEVCTIVFDFGLKINNIQYGSIIRGQVSNPYHTSVAGVGYNGIGEYSMMTHPIIYRTWKSMINRCYYEKELIKKPSYRSVNVCEEWKCFQNFAKWFEENYIEGFQLDKDILVKGNKIYSPETCCFVPKEINNVFVKADSRRGDLPLGVTKNGNNYTSRVWRGGSKIDYLGTYKTHEEAFQAYKIAKEAYIKELAEKWKDKITEQTYKSLYAYEVEITD